MTRTSLVPLAVAAFLGWASLIPAHAAPPTATPSPGYDARLQEQRAASQAGQPPVAPVVPPPGSKKPPKQPPKN
jgi:hypothetical protein